MCLTSDKKCYHRARARGVKTRHGRTAAADVRWNSSSSVTKRRSYTREEKLKVVMFYFDNGKNLYQTSKKILSEYEEHTTMDSGRRADPRQQQGTQTRRVPKDCTTPRDGKEALQWV